MPKNSGKTNAHFGKDDIPSLIRENSLTKFTDAKRALLVSFLNSNLDEDDIGNLKKALLGEFTTDITDSKEAQAKFVKAKLRTHRDISEKFDAIRRSLKKKAGNYVKENHKSRREDKKKT